jgi:hypothetical protein
MADYRFNVYLHTDRGEFSEDYSMSEYFYTLPSFYFTRNEFVSSKAEINIINSTLSCTGANIFNARASLIGLSGAYVPVVKSNYNNISAILGIMNSKALVPTSSVEYSDVEDYVYVVCYGIPSFD